MFYHICLDVMSKLATLFYSRNLHSCSIKIAWFEYVIIEIQC